MVAARGEGEASQRRNDHPRGSDIDLAGAFRTRAMEVFGRHDRSLGLAQDDAFRLWLAWRGDPSYLVANLSDRTERESSWRVVRYTEIPGLSEEYDHVEARSIGQVFPEHVLARLTQFVLRELSRAPGAEVEVEGFPGDQSSRLSREAVEAEAFGQLKAGRALTVRWPSNGAPGLSSRVLVLSKDSVMDSKYPALDGVVGPHRASDRGFTRFLERAERKRQKRWVRWATHG